MTASPIATDHNPACGTSRNTLAMIRASGEKPVELGTVPGRAGDDVREQAPCPGLFQRVALPVEALIARRYPRIAQDHGQNPPKTSTVLAWGSVPIKPL